MSNIINIHSQGEQVALRSGKNKIDIIGGWGIELGNFGISFRHPETQEIINSKRAFWRVQSYAFNKKVKRIFIVDILEAGHYIVEFKSPEDLLVKPANLFISSLFGKPIPNESIEVYIH